MHEVAVHSARLSESKIKTRRDIDPSDSQGYWQGTESQVRRVVQQTGRIKDKLDNQVAQHEV